MWPIKCILYVMSQSAYFTYIFCILLLLFKVYLLWRLLSAAHMFLGERNESLLFLYVCVASGYNILVFSHLEFL